MDEQLRAGLQSTPWYSDQVAAWLAEFEITACQSCPGEGFAHYRGSADAVRRIIHMRLRGDTRSSLLRWAHEIGHVVLRHVPRSVLAYEREWSATVWAIELMERDGIAVPQQVLVEWREYVARKIRGRLRAGRPVRAEAARWARVAVPR